MLYTSLRANTFLNRRQASVDLFCAYYGGESSLQNRHKSLCCVAVAVRMGRRLYPSPRDHNRQKVVRYPPPPRPNLTHPQVSVVIYDNDGGCYRACDPGTWVSLTDGSYECASCNPGYYCAGDCADPVACPAGTSRSDFGGVDINDCSACASGSYASETGSASCSPCPAGFECSDQTSEPVQCSAGSYSSGNAVSCEVCPVGYYCSNTGSSPEVCPEGTYSLDNWAYCVSCPPGHKCFNTAQVCVGQPLYIPHILLISCLSTTLLSLAEKRSFAGIV